MGRTSPGDCIGVFLKKLMSNFRFHIKDSNWGRKFTFINCASRNTNPIIVTPIRKWGKPPSLMQRILGSVRNSSIVTTLLRSLMPFEIIPSMSDVICHLNAESFITLELFHWWFVSHRVNDGPLRRCHGSKTTEWNIYWICHCTGAQSSLKVSNHSFWP